MPKRYPDDMDDTACALMSIERASGVHADTDALAGFARALISAETKPGGPYNTWIFSAGAGGDVEQWADVDPVVNANIACFLRGRGISLRNLDDFVSTALDKVLDNDESGSRYYLYVPALYFIFRAASDRSISCRAAGIKEALRAILGDIRASSLDRALAVISSVDLKSRSGEESALDDADIDRAVEALVSAQSMSGLWPSCPMYIESIECGETEYSGSEWLTTAISLQAISTHIGLCARANEKSGDDDLTAGAITRARAFLSSLPRPLSDQGAHELDDFIGTAAGRSSAGFSADFYRAISGAKTLDNIGLGDIDLCDLGAANVLGWIGSTIQDDIMDDGTMRGLLPLSNACLRESARLFVVAAPDEAARGYIDRAFLNMDRANAVEAGGCHDELSVWQKSFGHALGPMIVMARAGYGIGSTKFDDMGRSFAHYLTAKQLLDDAHDWEDDLARGRSTIVTDRLRRDHREGAAAETFWDRTIDGVARLIFMHAAQARVNAEHAGVFSNNGYIDELISPIERSASRALSERDESMTFLDALFDAPGRASRSRTSKAPAQHRA